MEKKVLRYAHFQYRDVKGKKAHFHSVSEEKSIFNIQKILYIFLCARLPDVLCRQKRERAANFQFFTFFIYIFFFCRVEVK